MTLEWPEVARRFEGARNWWVATAGPDGPHSVPVWGVVLDEVLVFYGAPSTVRSRNLTGDPRVVVHLEDGESPLIVHGRAFPTGSAKDRPELVEAYRRKYQQQHDSDYLLDTDYAAEALAFELEPSKAIAWTVTGMQDWTMRRWTSVSTRP